MSSPTVPNWIAKAVVYVPGYTGGGAIQPTTDWRATKTQVIVTVGGRDRRFYLDTLTEVGSGNRHSTHATRLLPADAPEVLAAIRDAQVRAARNAVFLAVEKARLQDSKKGAEETLRALDSIIAAATKAMASLTEVL